MIEGDGPRAAGRAWRLLVGRPDAKPWHRYAVGVALALAAVLTTVAVRGETAGFRALLYVGAVALAALRGGVGPGLSALVLCTVAQAGDGEPAYRWMERDEPGHRSMLFLAFGALSVWAAGALRDGFHQVHARRRRAEARADKQRVAAELGIRALAEGDLDALLGETLAAVRQALRCDAVSLLQLEPDGASLRLRRVAGWDGDGSGKLLGPTDAPLAFRALAAREALVVDDFADEPDLAPPLFLERRIVSSLVAPVVALGPGGRPFGVIGAHSRTHRWFGVDDVSFLQTAANVIGSAVVRLAAEDRVRRTLASQRFLAEASRQLALSIDFEETLGRVARLALPVLGDWCLLVLVDPDGKPRTALAEALHPDRIVGVHDLLSRYPIDLHAEHGVGRILRTGEPELVAEVTPDTFVVEGGPGSGVRRDILHRLGVRSYIGAPLVAGKRVLGAIGFGVAEGSRRYGSEDLELLQALTQRCATALENASLYRAAQEATRAREQVLAIVSHDLKTPLGALLIGARAIEQLAAPGAQGDSMRRAAASVRRTAERMRRLVHDLVDSAALEAGGISLERGRHDPLAIVHEAVESVRDLATERGVTMTCRVQGDAPALACDRDRVLQVLCNLLTNAIHVMEEHGRVDVEVAPGVGEITFTVADTGPGIPDEDLPRVFDRWYRGRTTRYSGSGLGLAIARAIVEAHGGRIWARSREGLGSAFAFALPAEPSAAATAEAPGWR